MIVMQNHDFKDVGIKKVRSCGEDFEYREIEFIDDINDTMLLSKEDVAALAKDFGIIVYERDVNI